MSESFESAGVLPRIRRRVAPGRCYEVAGKLVLDLHEAGRAPVLVHAQLDQHGCRMGHAWVELDTSAGTVVYDLTIRREPYQLSTYHDLYMRDGQARRYSATEAARALMGEGHYGPWPGDPAA